MQRESSDCFPSGHESKGEGEEMERLAKSGGEKPGVEGEGGGGGNG